MKEKLHAIKKTLCRPAALKIFRVFAKVVSAILIILSIAYLGFAWYMHTHKKEVLEQVTQLLNEKISGTLTIGNMETSLIEDFPRVAVRLNNIVIKDSLYNHHKKNLLFAEDAALTFHSLALLRGTVLIKKVSLKNATINLYTDARGYTNSKAIRKKDAAENKSESPKLDKVELTNVRLSIDNRFKGKLHDFTLNKCKVDIKGSSSGWKADAEIDALVHSLSFNIDKGSFIKQQHVKGVFDISFDEDKRIAGLKGEQFKIGKENFYVHGILYTAKPYGDFNLTLENKNISWKNAARFLPPNISSKLSRFTFRKPLDVRCEIKGFLLKRGEPSILVHAEVRNNTLLTPGGDIEQCNFSGRFSNEYLKGYGLNDANSIITLRNFNGIYEGLPFYMQSLMVQNLKVPVVKGDIRSNFDVKNLQNLVDDDLVMFSKGKGKIDLKFTADIKNFKISKPVVEGKVELKKATINYRPRNLEFSDIDASLEFRDDNLKIGMIDLKRGKSRVRMSGSVMNFLNLYYSDPEKVILKWDIMSPQLHLQDFISFAGKRNHSSDKRSSKGKGRFTEDLNTLFEKSSVSINMKIDRLYHNSFYASDAMANVLITEQALVVNNVSLKHADGSITAKGKVLQRHNGAYNSLNVTAKVDHVNISKFMASFKNFGLQALTAQNLKGSLSVTAGITGKVSDAGDIAQGSLAGNVLFTLKGGKLINFEPLRDIGRFAFPNRDVNNIVFSDLKGKFDINGDKVTVHPLKINSSVLNMDVSGLYSFGPGTKLFIDVPIRNPKRDEGITDADELKKRRNRGIVLHLVAEDDNEGKVRVKLGRKRK